MLASSSEKELEIVRDLSRTYPSHVYYQQRQGPGQRSLFNVLRAYSVYDRQVCPFVSSLACEQEGPVMHGSLGGFLQILSGEHLLGQVSGRIQYQLLYL